MLSVHTPHALSAHTTCSQCTHHMLSVHTPHVLSAHTTCSQCTHHMLSVHTPHALSTHTTCSQCTHQCTNHVWCELPLLPDSVLKSHYPHAVVNGFQLTIEMESVHAVSIHWGHLVQTTMCAGMVST